MVSKQMLQVANIGRGGALVEAVTLLPVHSVYAARLVLDGEETDVHLRVCHVRSIDANRFMLGLEFVDLSPAAAAAIDELLLQEAEEAPEGWEPQE